MPRAEVPALFARADVLVNNMEAGAPDKVVYEAAAACLPVLASNPVFDELFAGYPLLFERGSAESLAERLRWFAWLGAAERAEIGRTLRERVAQRHSVETWADGVLAARHERHGTVLHLQKVAGISGSEAHLLALLPRLKERGWDVRFLMLHEHEPGAWDFARELTARGIPLDSIPLAADVDPIAFLRLAAYLGRQRPRILHTHLVHADVYGQLAGSLTRVPVRVSTKHGFNEFRENRASRSATARSRALRTRTSRSRAAWRAISRRSKGSTARASRSSTTGSSRTVFRSRIAATGRGCCASGG